MGKGMTGKSLLLLFFCWPTQSQARIPGTPQAVVLRKDLSGKLGKILCTDRKALSTELSWQYGLNDAQLEGRFFLPRKGGDLTTPQEMVKRARSLAKRMHHHGYAGGSCPDGSGWAVSVPSPVEMQAVSKGVQILPLAELKAHCADIAVDFAPSTPGLGKSLNSSHQNLALKGLGAGTLSVSCLPKTPAWQGSVMWFLEPINTHAVAEIPGNRIFDHADAPEVALTRWVNEIRKIAQLKPVLYGNSGMAQATNLLSLGSSIIHNRNLYKNAETLLAGQKFSLLGEDRVKGSTIKEMAWHLWNSPRHRRLLLNAKATHLGIALQKQYDGYFAVIAMGTGGVTMMSGSPATKAAL